MDRAANRPRRPIVGIMGASEPSRESADAARELGRLVAERGWIVLTGGRDAGVMAAACAGAKAVRQSLTLGVLPGDREDVAPGVDIAVFTGMGDARNLINVLTADVVVACGVGSAGTASEASFALVAGKPLILLGASETARRFFRDVRARGRVYEAASASAAAELMEGELGLSRFTWD
jgi:uncharacterized protein (TIGR00725 family)